MNIKPTNRTHPHQREVLPSSTGNAFLKRRSAGVGGRPAPDTDPPAAPPGLLPGLLHLKATCIAQAERTGSDTPAYLTEFPTPSNAMPTNVAVVIQARIPGITGGSCTGCTGPPEGETGRNGRQAVYGIGARPTKLAFVNHFTVRTFCYPRSEKFEEGRELHELAMMETPAMVGLLNTTFTGPALSTVFRKRAYAYPPANARGPTKQIGGKFGGNFSVLKTSSRCAAML